MTETASLSAFVEDLTRSFDELFRDLRGYALAMTEAVGSLSTTDATPVSISPESGPARSDIQEWATRILQSHPLVSGAGVIFDPAQVQPQVRLIDWFSRTGDGEVVPHYFVHDTTSLNHYDYTQLPWFKGPFETGEPTLVGPYLDYLGVDELVLTATVPWSVGGQFLGLAGADIPVDSLEHVIQDPQRGLTHPLALVSAASKIICANTARLLPGDPIDEVTGRRLVLPTAVPTVAVHCED